MNDEPMAIEIWHKGQRVIRTVFQWLVGSIAPLTVLIGMAYQQWPVGWLGVALGISGAIQGFLAKVMANDAVNLWLSTHTFLGSLPKSVAQSQLSK